MIPKILHYVWLGKGEQSDTIKRCFESWKKHLPDYKFMFWNEETYDIATAPRFVQEAYNAKKWAFASDYIRLWALYQYGGIYLDTDTEVLKPLDRFLSHRLFIGTQVFTVDVDKNNKKNVTNLSMGIIGTEAGHPFIKGCIDRLKDSSITKPDGSVDTKVTNYTMSDILQNDFGFVVEDKLQELSEGIVVYPSTFFSDRLAPEASPDAYTFHWGEMSWFQPKPRGLFYKVCWNLNLMKFYHWIETIRK